MARGGYRPGAGRPKKEMSAKKETLADVPADIKSVSRKLKMNPLEYMLSVMNDETAEDIRRDRMAVAAAPYVHAKMAEDRGATRKEERQALAEERVSAGGRFSAPTPPHEMMN